MGWYPSCLTSQKPFKRGKYDIHNKYPLYMCIWGWVPSQGYHHFSYENLSFKKTICKVEHQLASEFHRLNLLPLKSQQNAGETMEISKKSPLASKQNMKASEYQKNVCVCIHIYIYIPYNIAKARDKMKRTCFPHVRNTKNKWRV